MKKIYKLLTVFLVCTLGYAQHIDYESMTSLILDDGTSVVVFGKLKKQADQNRLLEKWWKNWYRSVPSTSYLSSLPVTKDEYYYLPPQNSLRLEKTKDGSPKFTLIKYSGNTAEDSRGGILSFSMVFGLSKEQESELDEKLKKKLKNQRAKIRGSVQLWPKVGLNSGEASIAYVAIGSEEENTIAKTAAPLGENGRFSVIMKLDSESFQILEDAFKGNSAEKPLQVSLGYSYSVDVEAFTASISFDKGKYQKLVDDFERTTNRKDHWDFIVHKGTDITLDQTRSVFDELREAEVIVGDIRVDTNHMSADRAQELESQFYSFFFESFAQPTEFKSTKSRSASIDSLETSLEGLGGNYHIDISDETINDFMSRSKFNLNQRVSARKEWGFNSDFAAIIRNVDLNDDKHFREVNFDDPFFATRIISVQLAAGLSDLVGDQINGVEVRLRKKKKDGRFYYFDDQGSIFFNKKGDAGQLRSYNLSNDVNGDKTIEYKTIINHRGGFTEESGWDKSNETANIFVSTSLEDKVYKVKADLDELKENGIVGAICRIAYLKNGNQVIKEVLIDPDNDDSGVKEFTLVTDKGLRGYGVKLIYMHKDKPEPVILPWNEKRMFSIPFIFLSIPDELKGMSDETLDDYFEKYDFSDDDQNRQLLNNDGTLKEEVKKEGYDIFESNN